MKNRHKAFLALMVLIICISLSGCVPGDGANSEDHPAGFFSGVWHGWIAPVSLVISIFNRDRGIYEMYNNGLLYDLGYYMAIISGFGGLALSRKKRNTRRSDESE